jgi:CRP-like cAMP-binding protein
MSDLQQRLKTIEPFNQLPEPVLGQVAGLARPRSYTAGEFVTHYNDAWPYLALLETGSLEAVKESLEGRSLLVYKLRADDVFWGLTFFNENVKMPVSLRATEQSQLCLWSRQDILPILLVHGPALWSICGILIQRVQIASAIVEDLAFQPVAGRLAKMLLDAYGGKGSELLARDMTLDEMAARVGTTREMVCRLLYKFADEKWIDITRTEFRLIDQDELRQLSGAKAPS